MGCPPVRGDNPRALASGLSYVQVDKHGLLFYTTYISVDLAHHEVVCAKVGTGGMNINIYTLLVVRLICFQVLSDPVFLFLNSFKLNLEERHLACGFKCTPRN